MSADASPTQPLTSTPDEERSHKRQRVAIACEVCRAKKIKCDAARPTCTPCRTRRRRTGEICEYVEHEHQYRAQPKSYVRHLEERIRDMQQHVNETRHGASNSSQPASSPSITTLAQGAPARPTVTPTVAVDPATADRSRWRCTVAVPTSVPLGSASAASFIQQIRAAIDARAPGSGASLVSRGIVSSSGPSHPRHRVQDHNLPPKPVADRLCDLYWTNVHPIFPFVDRIDFEAQYNCLWTDGPASLDDVLSMCTRHMLFALGWQQDAQIPPQARLHSANLSYECARKHMEAALWDVETLSNVRCLLLMCQYLLNSDSIEQASKTLELLKRTAYGLKLDMPETSASMSDSRRQEGARRLWHGVLHFDYILNMILGQIRSPSPPATNQVPLPTHSDEGLLSADTPRSQPSNHALISFYLKHLSLVEIMDEIFNAGYAKADSRDVWSTDAYHALLGWDISETTISLFHLDRKLMAWHTTLGTLGDDPEHRPRSTLERKTLKVFYNHARLLLHRPIMSRFCLARNDALSSGQSLPQQVALASSTTCLKASHEIIDLIYDSLDKESAIGLPVPWFCAVLLLYSAAIVIQAVRLRPIVALGLQADSFQRSWTRALEALRVFSRLGQTAERCAVALEILDETISRVVSPAGDSDLPLEVNGTSARTPFPPQSPPEKGTLEKPFSFNAVDWTDFSWLSNLSTTVDS